MVRLRVGARLGGCRRLQQPNLFRSCRLMLLLLILYVAQAKDPPGNGEKRDVATSPSTPETTAAPGNYDNKCGSELLTKVNDSFAGNDTDVAFFLFPPFDDKTSKPERVYPTNITYGNLTADLDDGFVSQFTMTESDIECGTPEMDVTKCSKANFTIRDEKFYTRYKCEKEGKFGNCNYKIRCQMNNTANFYECNNETFAYRAFFFDGINDRTCWASSYRLVALAGISKTTTTAVAAAPTTTTSTTTSKKVEPEKEPTRLPPPPPPDKPEEPKQTKAPPAPPATPPPSGRPETQPPPTPPEAKTTEEEATTDAANNRRFFEWAVAWWLLWSALF